MGLDYIKISKAIIESYKDKFVESLEVDVAIVGAGPAGMTCAYYLARSGRKMAQDLLKKI